MSSRKNIIVIGCTGYVCSPPFNGDYVTRHCSECSFAGNNQACSEFKRSVRFTKIRTENDNHA